MCQDPANRSALHLAPCRLLLSHDLLPKRRFLRTLRPDPLPHLTLRLDRIRTVRVDPPYRPSSHSTSACSFLRGTRDLRRNLSLNRNCRHIRSRKHNSHNKASLSSRVQHQALGQCPNSCGWMIKRRVPSLSVSSVPGPRANLPVLPLRAAPSLARAYLPRCAR